ncbi:MAG: hypothetical protein V1744_07305 [Candidatus Altiarchaeota archaeon]
MFEVVVDGLSYIRGIPVELTDSARAGGELRRGCVVGLLVHPVDDACGGVVVEVKLTEEGQERLISPGLRVPLEGEGLMLRFALGWSEYLNAQSPLESTSVVGKPDCSSLKPVAGASR